MKTDRNAAPGVVMSLALALALGGCVVSGPRVAVEPVRVGWVTPVVVAAPPAAVVEVQGVAPQPGYLWINGYWNWVGNSHVWVGGHWASPPHAGYYWVPHEWVRHEGGWRLREGHWAHR